MGFNERGVIGTGINQGSESFRGRGGVGGISKVYASIIWSITDPTTYTSASENVESGRTSVSDIGCATTTLNASSFKRSGSGTLKNLIETGSRIVLSPVVLMLALAAPSPPSP